MCLLSINIAVIKYLSDIRIHLTVLLKYLTV